MTGDEQCVGTLGVEHGDAIGAGDHLQGGANRLLERFARHRGDQVREHLGIGVGTKLHPLGEQLCA